MGDREKEWGLILGMGLWPIPAVGAGRCLRRIGLWEVGGYFVQIAVSGGIVRV